jgi:hypothetical protein
MGHSEFGMGLEALELVLRVCEEIIWTLCCWHPGPLARREQTSIPGAVCKERATRPAALRAAARRGAAARARIGFVAAPRRCPTSPASRRLASARPALVPKCSYYFVTDPKGCRLFLRCWYSGGNPRAFVVWTGGFRSRRGTGSVRAGHSGVR